MASAEHIVTSTGGLGMGKRPDGRLYLNGTGFADNPELVARYATKINRLHDRQDSDGTARTVFRGVVSSDVMKKIVLDDGIKPHLEAALPLGEFTGDDSVLVSLGRNGKNRKSNTRFEVIKAETEIVRTEIPTPLSRVEKLVDKGFTFTNTITDADIPGIMELWGGTFGWTKQEVIGLQHRLQAGIKIDARNKDVWFSALKSPDNKIVGISFAERLQRPGKDGKIIDTVESTDWRVHPDYEGNGFMPATLGMLNAQVLEDLKDTGNGLPIIYAECNFTTRADLPGVAAGFQIPSRDIAPQAFIQNAEVDGKRRDFSFMYMSKSTIDQHYSIEARAAMTAHLNPVKV